MSKRAWLIAAIFVPIAATAASAQLLPADRTTTWKPGIPGGVPHRTTICATIAASTYANGAQDARAGIQAALDACPEGRVVMLSAGKFTVNNYLLIHSGITLRGAGAELTWLGKANGARARTSRMRPVDPSTYSYVAEPVVIIGPQRWVKPDASTSQNLATDGVKESRSVSVSSTRGFAAGQFVLVDELSGASWHPTPPGFPGAALVWQGDRVAWNMHLPVQRYQDDNRGANASGPFDTAPGTMPPSMSWFARADRPTNEIKEIATVSERVITFTTPLHITYRTSHVAQLTRYTGANVHVKSAGVEDFTVVGGADGQIRFEDAAYSWAKNIENTQWLGEGFAVDGSFRIEIRDSYIHDGSWPQPGGAGYAISLASGTSEVLVENNIIVDACKNIVARSSGAGSVFGYNHLDDSWDFDNPTWVEVALNASHMAGPHHVLFEGNYAPNIDSDFTHGNAIDLTFFRNWLSGQRRSFIDRSNVRTIGLAYGSWWDSFLGNVLGRAGQMAGWIYDAQAMNGKNAKWRDKALWKLGYDPERWDMFADPQVLSTTIRGGNFDYLTNTVHWENIREQPLPNSLYLTAKPAFFGANPWPWVDPAGAARVYTLPATQRYDRLRAAR
jgi:hypothetical protein